MPPTKLEIKKIKIITKKFDLTKLPFPLNDDDKKELALKLPKPDVSLTFELHNTNVKFANSLRRCLIDELDLYSLTCKLENIKSNDHKITAASDCIMRQLNLIPLTQHIISPEKIPYYNIFINVTNETTDTISVTAGDIKIEIHSKPNYKKRNNLPRKKKQTHDASLVDSSLYFSDKINVCDLGRGCYLKVENITITSQKNYNIAIGSIISGVKYIPIEYEDELAPNTTKTLPSSLITTPTKYRIEYTVNGGTHILYPITLACKELLDRLNLLYNIITKSGELPYYSNKVNITYDGSLILYKINEESWTIGYLLSWYCYQVDPDIPYIAVKNEHALIHTIILRIRHTDHKKIVLLALTNIIVDYNILLSAFNEESLNK